MDKSETFSGNNILFCEYRSGNASARDRLIEANTGLVTCIAVHFKGRGQEFEDIVEVGKIGLIKAIEGFDEKSGYSFSTYAFPLITGEIKRFLRDDGLIKLSRVTKKNASDILSAKQKFIKMHGREPRISELSELCSLSCEEIVASLEATSPVLSLQEKIGTDDSGTELCDLIPGEDILSHITEKIALRQMLYKLSDDERKLIELRFFREFTQAKTARVLGVSQVTVSRSEKKILEKLRQQLAGY